MGSGLCSPWGPMTLTCMNRTPVRILWQLLSRILLLSYGMSRWRFLTNHARAMLYIADRPDARLRELALALEVTERTAFGIVVDLAQEGYLVKAKEGRCNRYSIQDHLPLRDPIGRERTIGEVLSLFSASKREGDTSVESPGLTAERVSEQ